MAKEWLTRRTGDYLRSFATEDGKHIRKEKQELQPVMDRVKRFADINDAATRSSNPNEWHYIGSVPVTVLWDWLKKHGYNMHDWAVNKDGCKDRFKSYFLSRDFSKLHTQHVTTKRGASSISVPRGTYTGVKNAVNELRGAEGLGSGLVRPH